MPFHVPVDVFKLSKPDADWPPHIDFMQTLGGVLTLGLDLQREPIDIKFPSSLGGQAVRPCSIIIKKGFKRLTTALLILKTSMMSFEPEDNDLDCVMNVLLRLAKIPVAYSKKSDDEGHVFDYIMLSNRQALRQRLNPLQLAFLMDMLADERAAKTNDAKGGKRDRVVAVVEDYNKQPGVRDMKPWQISTEERWALCNISIGLSQTSKTMLRVHLNRFKWVDCALTRDHCRSTAWLVGCSDAKSGTSGTWKELLTVTEASQEYFLSRYLETFQKSHAIRRGLKKQNLSRSSRLSTDDFVMASNVAAVYLALEHQFKTNSSAIIGVKTQFCLERRRMFADGCPCQNPRAVPYNSCRAQPPHLQHLLYLRPPHTVTPSILFFRTLTMTHSASDFDDEMKAFIVGKPEPFGYKQVSFFGEALFQLPHSTVIGLRRLWYTLWTSLRRL